MDIFLSINNREQVIKLPVVPVKFKVKSPWSNTTWDTISIGKIKLIGRRDLKGITIPSFFPNRDYPFSRDKSYSAWEYVNIIEEWRKRRIPVRLIITDTPINEAMAIDDFVYGPEDGYGDVYYDLVMEEFKFPLLQQRQV